MRAFLLAGIVANMAFTGYTYYRAEQLDHVTRKTYMLYKLHDKLNDQLVEIVKQHHEIIKNRVSFSRVAVTHD